MVVYIHVHNDMLGLQVGVRVSVSVCVCGYELLSPLSVITCTHLFIIRIIY